MAIYTAMAPNQTSLSDKDLLRCINDNIPSKWLKDFEYRKDIKAPLKKLPLSLPLLKMPQNEKLSSSIKNAKVETRRTTKQRMIITMTKIKK